MLAPPDPIAMDLALSRAALGRRFGTILADLQ
jgi:hypothetical protein